MQYELKTQVIEPQRHTFTHVAKRFGDKPASRYLEGSIDVQPTEHFHYRPTWDPTKEIYDESFSVFRLADPYSYLDPRQYYYAPYVTARSGHHDAFGTSLEYIENRGLLGRLPDGWSAVLGELVVPLRHLESAGQLILCGMARFGYGATITQAAAYSAFDRVGNAQMISRVGIALGGGTTETLTAAKDHWMGDESLQGLRRLAEETIVEADWGVALIQLDALDQLVYDLLWSHLDDAAVTGGAPAYSLIAQHMTNWYTDNRTWIDALYAAWRADPELGAHNADLLAEHGRNAVDTALAALTPFAQRLDARLDAGALERVAATAAASLATFAADQA
ncbi:phenol 2-monooxygenase [Kribbia dieselivorans]|uniref:phenol 2-monooxygenase n=1 Tax=Kribbia dieselivorans TaxID=331526 RepID=UPI000838CAEF|nr:phenol 2-monooxygenase [Kribbia dieselivorans]